MVNSDVTSSAALATLTVATPIFEKDILLRLVAQLASPLQLKLVVKAKGTELNLMCSTNHKVVLKERNAILRGLAGPILHHALDDTGRYEMLGGHSRARNMPISAMALACITSWMSCASNLRNHVSDPAQVVQELESYLKDRAFLAPSAVPTLADMDLMLALMTAGCDENLLASSPNVMRWMEASHARLLELTSIVSDGVSSIKIPSLAFTPASSPMPVFFYGNEDFVAPPAAGKNVADVASTEGKAKVDVVGVAQAKQPQPQGGGGAGLTEEQKKAAADKRAKKKAEAAAKKAQNAPPPATATTEVDISALDIRVGKILKAWHHEEAEKLFCEEIDVGEDKPRQIASGLRPFYQMDDLTGRHVLVLCNLKPRNLVGFPSHGMVLCASNDDHTQVEFVVPPPDSMIGERVVFEGIDMKDPESESKVNKKKLFENLAPDLKTDGDGTVVWKKHKAIVPSVGKPTVALNGMPNAHVS
jgi:methionine--tRNA ligase beta chain